MQANAVTDPVALATHVVVSAPNLGFCDVSVTTLCVPSEQSVHLLRLSHIFEIVSGH